jgi:putative ABC transport system permease protein
VASLCSFEDPFRDRIQNLRRHRFLDLPVLRKRAGLACLKQIGVRIALGAQWRDVMKLIFTNGMLLVIVGLTIGLAGALALTRLMTTLLFEVSPTDPITFGAVALCVILATLLACYIPARRAAKVDPLVALRYE